MARILGIDYDRSALYGAVVRASFRKVEVERYVRVPLEPSSEEDAGEARPLQDAMDRMARALGTPTNAVCAALSGRQVSLRKITLPKAAEKRAAEVLVFELESVLPFDVDEAVIDHQPVGTHGDSADLLAAAVLEKHVEQRLAELSAGGIEARDLCPAPLYLENLAQQVAPLESTLVLELRNDVTEVALVVGGHCRTARTLTSTPGSDEAQAARFLRSLQLTLSSFQASGEQAPERVLLTGPGAAIPEMAGWLAAQLDLPVTLLNLPAPLAGKPSSPHHGRALGLALRGCDPGKRINLRKGRYAHAHAGPQWAKHANLLVTCGVAILVSVMFSLKAEQTILLDEQTMLQAQLAETTKTVFGKSASTVGGAELLLKNPKGVDPLPRFDAFDALSVLSGAIEADVEHEVRRLRIEIGDDKRVGRIELQGKVSSLEQRDTIATQLDAHPCISELEQGKTSSVRGSDNIKYQLEAEIQCPGEGPKKKKGRKSGKGTR